VYTARGRFDVGLTVWDDKGASATKIDEAEITVD
jgi:hypothetical protein